MVIYVDVDDTLVRTAGTKRIPMVRTVARVKELAAEGHELYLWSTGGAEYARESAAELGIEGLFMGFLPKPQLYIDDQVFGEWRGLVYERPGQS